MQDGAPVGRVAFGLTLLAVLYSAGLLAAVVAVPAVDGETLLEHGGSWSVAIFAQPLLLSLLLWDLLRSRCRTGSRGATRAARIVATLYLLYSVLAGFTLAAGALPAALLLFIAALVTPRGPLAGP